MFKTFIQIVLILTLSLILVFIFYKYFYSESIKEKENVNETRIIENVIEEKILQQNDKDSTIYNLSYKKFDIQGNVYLIEASEGTIKENTNEVLMKQVKATINYMDNEKLFIYSTNAIFNNKTFQTNFYNGVKVIFKEQKLQSNNLDFLFDKNIAIFKDNVKYYNQNVEAFGDIVVINILTKEIDIKSKDQKKIIIKKKN